MGYIETVEKISEIINTSFNVPFQNKIMVNKDEIEQLLEELRSNTPTEFNRAKAIVANQKEYIEKAKLKGEMIIDDARKRADEIVSTSSIIERANSDANTIIENAKDMAKEIVTTARVNANEIKTASTNYVIGIMKETDKVLCDSIHNIRTVSKNLENSSKKTGENKNEY